MIGLIPRDYWEVGFADTLSAWVAACSRRLVTPSLDLPGIGECHPVRTGRAALVLALQALGLRQGACIGVPLYCCPVLFDAISAAGCIPRFLDVEPANFCLTPGIVARSARELDAVVAVHMFGHTCDVPGIRAAAPGVAIIEDCAQALGSRLAGRPVGTLGHAAFFSFRSGKYLSVGEGGALYSVDEAVFRRIGDLVARLPKLGLSEELRHVAVTGLKSVLRRQPLYGAVGFRIWNRSGGSHKKPRPSKPILSRIHRSDFVVVRRRFAGLASKVEAQRANARYLLEHLRLPAQMLCQEPEGTTYNRYLFPIVFGSMAERDRMAERLGSGGVDSMKYLDGVVEAARELHGYPGDCPTAERLSRCALAIPCYHALTGRQLSRVAAAVNSSWEDRISAGR